jgi:hypothetical protein
MLAQFRQDVRSDEPVAPVSAIFMVGQPPV